MKIAVAIATLVALSTTVRADPSPEDLFNAGQHEYEGGNYARAIDLWRESYRLSQEPGLLFNIGHAQRLAGDCASALASYRQFVVLDPSSDRRADAEELVHELAATCRKPEPPRDARRVPERVESGHSLKLAGLGTGGAGVALMATGLLIGRHASTLGNEVSGACSHGCTWADQRSKDSAGRRDAAVGYTLDGLGVAAIATGAVMYFLGARETTVVVAPRPGEGGAIISWRTSW